MRELLGEKFADDEEDKNDRKHEKSRRLFIARCVREHKLAINAHVIVPVLNYVYSQLRRKKDENGDLKVLLCVLTGDSLSGWNVRRRVLEALEKDGDTTSDDQEKNRMKEMEREMMFATFVQTKVSKVHGGVCAQKVGDYDVLFSRGRGEKRSPNTKKRRGYDDVIIIVIK